MSAHQKPSIQLMSIDGRLQDCGICGQPALGLFGQDQMVTEGMAIQTQSCPLPVGTGWFHNICILELEIGLPLFEARVLSLRERGGQAHSGFFVSYHEWLKEIQICNRDGAFWLTTLDDFNSASQVPGGLAIPVEHDIDVCVIGKLECLNSFRVDSKANPANPVSLIAILNDLGILERVCYPNALTGGQFLPSPSASPSVLAGRLKYHLFLPDTTVSIAQRMELAGT